MFNLSLFSNKTNSHYPISPFTKRGRKGGYLWRSIPLGKDRNLFQFRSNNKNRKSGKVFLVGAGPGDPELLTIKALKVIKNCDIIIYDALVNSEIINHVGIDTEKIFVGPLGHKLKMKQKEIELIMIDHANNGKCVVRLKGGDPFIFGRGGEEAEALSEAGIEWEIIPGVSAGHAVPAYAGIPLTHRDYSSSVAFVTGHECKNKSTVQWKELAQIVDTFVIFMGLKNLSSTIEKLINGGLQPSTPIAVIESGTTFDQQVKVATLETIIHVLKQNSTHSPALIVIGKVVNLHSKLSKKIKYNLNE